MKSTRSPRPSTGSARTLAPSAVADPGQALAPPAYGIDFVDRSTAPGSAPAAREAPGAPGAVVQRWPKWLDRLRNRSGHQKLVSDDDRLAQDVKSLGHRAQTQQETIEAKRRDKVGEGLGQVAEEGVKMGLDVGGLATTGVPIGTVVGALRSAQSVASSGYQAHRETGSGGSTAKAVGKAVLQEGVGEAVGHIPVVGEFIGMGQGLVTAATGVFESESSRGKTKQKAIDAALSEGELADQARQRLADGDLEATHQRRLQKGLARYDETLDSARGWQEGKAKKGKLPLLSEEVPELEDEAWGGRL